MKKSIASIYIILGATSFGLTSPITKLAYANAYTPSEVSSSQILLGLGGFMVIILFNWQAFFDVPKRDISKLIIFGFISGLTPIFFYLSLSKLPASIAIVFLFQFTWMGIILEAWRRRRLPSIKQIIALCFILFGTIFAADLSIDSLRSLNIEGAIYGILSAFSYTFFLDGTSNLATNINPLIRSCWQMFGQAGMVFIAFPPIFVLNYPITSSLYLYGAIFALLGCIIPPLLFMKATPYMGTGMTSILGSVELPVVVIVSYLMVGEVVHLLQWIGICLMIIGIVISEMNFRTINKNKVIGNQQAGV